MNIDALLKLLDKGMDNALLRFTLAQLYHQQDEHDQAIGHLKAALDHQPGYTAAWKLLGKAYTAAGDDAQACDSYRRGIEVASAAGDKQAEKEMQVFLKRLLRQRG